MAATSILTLIGYVLGIMAILFIVLPATGRFLHLRIGGAAANANSVDGSMARLIKQVEGLQTPTDAPVEALTIDSGYYLVSFNNGQDKNGKAVRPSECNGACICACIDETCTKINIDQNKARDCRSLQFEAIVVQDRVDDNKGAQQKVDYLTGPGYYMNIKGFTTFEVIIEKKDVGGKTNLYLGRKGSI